MKYQIEVAKELLKEYEEEYKEKNNKVNKEIIKPIPLYTITKDWFFGNKLIKSISEDVSDDLLYIDRNLKNNGYELIDGKYYCNLDSEEVIVITLSKFEHEYYNKVFN